MLELTQNTSFHQHAIGNLRVEISNQNLYEEDKYGNRNAVSIRGNTNMGPNSTRETLNWDTWQYCGVDIRMFYAQSRDPDSAWTNCRW